MKNVFFFLFLFTSFTATAQFPKAGQNGYKKTKVGDFHVQWTVENSRNKFVIWGVGDYTNGLPDPNDSMTLIKSLLGGHKVSFNKKYFYSTYKDKKGFCYEILIYSRSVMLLVRSKFNDAEFEQCKKMLDNEAETVIREHGYSFTNFN